MNGGSGDRSRLFCMFESKENEMAYDNPEDTLVLETTKGQVVIKLRPDLAPNHVARVKELAREGFYDELVSI